MRTWWLGGRLHLRRRLDAIDEKLARLLAGQTALGRAQGDVMATLDDLIAKVQGETDVETGLSMAIDTLIAQDADLAARLKAAIAANDPTKIQAVADALDANAATLAAKKQAVVDAVVAGT